MIYTATARINVFDETLLVEGVRRRYLAAGSSMDNWRSDVANYGAGEVAFALHVAMLSGAAGAAPCDLGYEFLDSSLALNPDDAAKTSP